MITVWNDSQIKQQPHNNMYPNVEQTNSVKPIVLMFIINSASAEILFVEE